MKTGKLPGAGVGSTMQIVSTWYFPQPEPDYYVVQSDDLFLCREETDHGIDEWWSEFGHKHMVKIDPVKTPKILETVTVGGIKARLRLVTNGKLV